ncbi:LOW QUALITY PROTEIN: hypothetical protein CVT25_003095, partial [Psilocybe cyanescens]
ATDIVELYSRLVKRISAEILQQRDWDLCQRQQAMFFDIPLTKLSQPKVLGAYEWLSENYKPEDRIFLFGELTYLSWAYNSFLRAHSSQGLSVGAYQARVIASMIEKLAFFTKETTSKLRCSVLDCDFTHKELYSTYDLYTRTVATKKVKELGESDELCKRFKQTLSRQSVRVHFVGSGESCVFLRDSVERKSTANPLEILSIGVFRGPNLPETTTGIRHVCIFQRALALHSSYESNSYRSIQMEARVQPIPLIQSTPTDLHVLRGPSKRYGFLGLIRTFDTRPLWPTVAPNVHEAIKQGLKKKTAPESLGVSHSEVINELVL